MEVVIIAAMETSLLMILVAGCLFFPLLYLFSVYVIRRYNHCTLADVDIYVISEELVCSIQALFACVSGAIIMYSCQVDILHDKHWLTNAYAMFGVPYFYYDMGVMTVIYWHLHPVLKNSSWWQISLHLLRAKPLILAHHIIFPIVYLPVIVVWRQDLGDFFVGCFYLVELAVPCLSLRGVLVQLQMKNSKVYRINGMVLIATWIICRILVFPFMYWIYGKKLGTPMWRVFMLIPNICNAGCLLLLTFQLYWLGVMMKIAYRTLSSSAESVNSEVKCSRNKQI